MLRRSSWRVAALALLLTAAPVLQAEIGLVLSEATRDGGAARWTSAGHAAVYLSGVCVKSPVELRLCEPGENGTVLSNYRHFEEDRPYEWNAMQLNLYLYGVEDEADRPLYVTPTVRWILQERYRQRHLTQICAGRCATDPRADWREMIGTTFLRDVYVFAVKTTRQQDAALVERLNHSANVNRYSGFKFNCADFAREVVNSYFPGAARRDRLNDFWVTSPKAIAKSFAHYGVRHPELEFHVTRYSQLPGEYARSHDNRKGTEQLFRSNRWRLPLAAIYPATLALWTGSYLATGRFNPERELNRRPDAESSRRQAELLRARRLGDPQAEEICRQQLDSARTRALGSAEEWASYAEQLRQYEADAGSDPSTLLRSPAHMVAASWIDLDDSGGMWLRPRDGHSHPRVGLSASTLQASGSDADTAYRLALAHLDAELHRKPKNRETLSFFRSDWALMEQVRSRVLAQRQLRPLSAASQPAADTAARGMQ